MGLFEYKGFKGSLNFQTDACYFYGNVLLTRDNVRYEAGSMDELERNFRNSIDNYLADCAAIGVEPG